MAWYSEGEKSNPADGDLLATTGKLPFGNNVPVTVVVSATVAAVVLLRYRDAAGSTNKQVQTIRVLANDTKVIPLGTHPINVDEALQVVSSGVTLGLVQASIVY